MNKIQVLYKSIISSQRIKDHKEKIKLINDVVKFSASLYKDETTLNGEPYIMKPLEIANICANELGLSYQSVCAVLMYHAVETEKVKLSEVEDKIGLKAFKIIEGRLRIAKLQNDKSYLQSEKFRKLFITLSEDIRIILTKLADLLYSLRHAQWYSSEIQEKLAMDATILYAPTAYKLGLYNLKLEMEDLALKITQVSEYKAIENKLKDTQKSRETYINTFVKPIEEGLKNAKIDAETKYRTKSINSIHQKMLKQKVEFEGVYDIFAIRVIIDCPLEEEKALCWKAYSLITDKYTPNPSRLRDWISIPKSSGYESLHTTVMGPEGRWVEIQIRSKRMDEIAEKGVAAHWRYKGVKSANSLDNYLNQIRELLDNISQTDGDVVNQFALEVESDEIFVFTPQGDLKTVPKGATVLDFAFEVHTLVGGRCVAAKVNNKAVKLRHVLNNGDQVEIITSKNQRPAADWLNIVKTSKAKSGIRKFLQEERQKEANIGKEIFDRKLKNWKLEIEASTINKVQKKYKLKTANDLYFLIGTGKIEMQDVRDFIIELQTPVEVEQTVVPTPAKSKIKSNQSSDVLSIDQNLTNVNYHFANCCNPIKGDSIAGFVSIGKGITIHRINCKNFLQLQEKYPYRIQEASWHTDADDQSFIANIKVLGNDQMGILNNISEVISTEMKINMQSISVNSKNGQFEGMIKVMVNDTQTMEALIHRLLRVKGVTKVSRINQA